MDTSYPPYMPPSLPIPFDLFVSRQHPGIPPCTDIGFADSSGNIVYKFNRQSSSKSSPHKRLLVDSYENPLISIYRQAKGSWQGFKGDSSEEKDQIFRVQRTNNTFTRSEFEVFIVGENWGNSTSDFKVNGCPFQKSCTISRGDSIMAQTSLMYKLGQIYVRRNKFRLTIFPEPIDPTVVVALVVIFFNL